MLLRGIHDAVIIIANHVDTNVNKIFSSGDCSLSLEDLENKITEKLANLLMMSAEDIDKSQPMVHYGVDSLISLDVTNWMRKEFNLQVNQMDILEGMTTESLIQQALG